MYNLTKTGVLIGIGSNLRGHMSNPKNNLKIVFKYLLRNGLRVVKFSKIYINRPHPGGLGPLFCNSVVLIKTDMCALDILKRLKKIENIFGRRSLVKNSPRVMDLDLIDCRGEVIKLEKKLILPHPEIYNRDFVLYPIFDLNPVWKDPNSYRNIKDLLVKYSRKNLNKMKTNSISYLHV